MKTEELKDTNVTLPAWTELNEESMDNGSLGQIAYEAFCNHIGWKSPTSGAQLPGWTAVKPEIQAAWEAAIDAVADQLAEDYKAELEMSEQNPDD